MKKLVVCYSSSSNKNKKSTRFMLVILAMTAMIFITNLNPVSAKRSSVRGGGRSKTEEGGKDRNYSNNNVKNGDTTSSGINNNNEEQHDDRNLMVEHLRESPAGFYTGEGTQRISRNEGGGRPAEVGGTKIKNDTTKHHQHQQGPKEVAVPNLHGDDDHHHTAAHQEGSSSSSSSSSSPSYYYITAGKERHKVSKTRTEFERVDHVGITHKRFQTTIDDIPVFGHESIVHHKPGEGEEEDRITTDSLPDLTKDLNPIPTIREEDAIKTAKAYHLLEDVQGGGVSSVTVLEGTELNIFIQDDENVYLTYKVPTEIRDENEFLIGRPLVFVDAHFKNVVIKTIETMPSAWLLDADKVTLYPINATHLKVGDSSNATLATIHSNIQSTLDLLNTAKIQYDSYDGKGAQIKAVGHYGNKLNNAFWDGRFIVFGDGDLVNNGTGHFGVLDVVAHEIGHALTEYSSKLIYQNESGALNEAASDILSAAVTVYVDGEINENVWMMGEDIFVFSENKAIRYMNRPSADGYSRDHYNHRYIGTRDHGGVHFNSGIANHWFYLLVVGGQHHNSTFRTGTVINGIGMETAFDIWFEAWTDELTPSSTFQHARNATIEACKELGYDLNTICASVGKAWDEVGVKESNSCISVELHIRTDNGSFSENSLSLKSTNGEVIWDEKSSRNNTDYAPFKACLDSTKCYTLEFNDPYGDGLKYLGKFKLVVDEAVETKNTVFLGPGYKKTIGAC